MCLKDPCKCEVLQLHEASMKEMCMQLCFTCANACMSALSSCHYAGTCQCRFDFIKSENSSQPPGVVSKCAIEAQLHLTVCEEGMSREIGTFKIALAL